MSQRQAEEIVSKAIYVLLFIYFLSGAVYDLGRLYISGTFSSGVVVDVLKVKREHRRHDRTWTKGEVYNSYIEYAPNRKYRIRGKLIKGKKYSFSFLPYYRDVHNVYSLNPFVNLEIRILLLLLFCWFVSKSIKVIYINYKT